MSRADAREQEVSFIRRLSSLGIFSAKVQVGGYGKSYVIRDMQSNDKLIFNVHSTVHQRRRGDDILSWYSADLNLSANVKWLIYLTERPDFFYVIPLFFIETIKASLWAKHSLYNNFTFHLNVTEGRIEGKDWFDLDEIKNNSYCFDFEHCPEHIEKFKTFLRIAN